ncbi:MAG: hypothetical protein EHM19_04605, partial [Candidatus Latescibacterota bacterium]
ANFTYEVRPRTVRYRDALLEGGAIVLAGEEKEHRVGAGKRPSHQIANIADLCNDCGNCDVFCPEDGGPQNRKPRVFLFRDAFEADPGPGFYLERAGTGFRMLARQDGARAELRVEGDLAVFHDGSAELVFIGEESAPREMRPLPGAPNGHVVPVGLYLSMRALAEALLSDESASFPAARLAL